MSRRFEIAPEARADIEDIGVYLRLNAGARISSAVRRRIRESILSIQRAPLTGAPRPDLGRGTRIAICQRWVIYYRVTEEACEIIRVLDSARDAGKVFGLPESPL